MARRAPRLATDLPACLRRFCVIGVVWVLRVIAAGLRWHIALTRCMAAGNQASGADRDSGGHGGIGIRPVHCPSPTIAPFVCARWTVAKHPFTGAGAVWPRRRHRQRLGHAPHWPRRPTSNVTLSLWSMCIGMLVLAAIGHSWAKFVLGALAWGGGVALPATPRSRLDWWPPRRPRGRQHYRSTPA